MVVGHDEGPVLDGRGLRAAGRRMGGICAGSFVSVVGGGVQYSDGSRRVVAWRGRRPSGSAGPSISASVMIHSRVAPRS